MAETQKKGSPGILLIIALIAFVLELLVRFPGISTTAKIIPSPKLLFSSLPWLVVIVVLSVVFQKWNKGPGLPVYLFWLFVVLVVDPVLRWMSLLMWMVYLLLAWASQEENGWYYSSLAFVWPYLVVLMLNIGVIPDIVAKSLFALVPVWFYIILLNRSGESKFVGFVCVVVLLLWVGGVAVTYRSDISEFASVRGVKVIAPQVGIVYVYDTVYGVGQRWYRLAQGVPEEVQIQLAIAKGEPIASKVDDQAKLRDLVSISYIDGPKEASKNEGFSAATSVKARVIDADFNMGFSCFMTSENYFAGTIVPSVIHIDRLGAEELVRCDFSPDQLKLVPVGYHEVNVVASFEYRALSYVRAFFLSSDERSRVVKSRKEIKSEDDLLSYYKIPVGVTVSTTTPGPVAVGIDVGKSPVTVDVGKPELKRSLSFSLTNNWPSLGVVKNVRSVIVMVPNEFEPTFVKRLTKTGEAKVRVVGCNGLREEYQLGCSDKYTVVEVPVELLPKDIKSTEKFVLELVLKSDRARKLFDQGGLSPAKYFNIIVDYDYEVKQKLPINIVEEYS